MANQRLRGISGSSLSAAVGTMPARSTRTDPFSAGGGTARDRQIRRKASSSPGSRAARTIPVGWTLTARRSAGDLSRCVRRTRRRSRRSAAEGITYADSQGPAGTIRRNGRVNSSAGAIAKPSETSLGALWPIKHSAAVALTPARWKRTAHLSAGAAMVKARQRRRMASDSWLSAAALLTPARWKRMVHPFAGATMTMAERHHRMAGDSWRSAAVVRIPVHWRRMARLSVGAATGTASLRRRMARHSAPSVAANFIPAHSNREEQPRAGAMIARVNLHRLKARHSRHSAGAGRIRALSRLAVHLSAGETMVTDW